MSKAIMAKTNKEEQKREDKLLHGKQPEPGRKALWGRWSQAMASRLSGAVCRGRRL
jgi:hypothetical protein